MRDEEAVMWGTCPITISVAVANVEILQNLARETESRALRDKRGLYAALFDFDLGARHAADAHACDDGEDPCAFVRLEGKGPVPTLECCRR